MNFVIYWSIIATIIIQTFAVQIVERKGCMTPSSLIDEISSYDSAVKKIVDYVLNGPYKNKTYNDLSDFVDKFGPRMSGTETLERSIDYVVKKSHQLGLNVHTETVEVPHWVRGEESAVMLQPRYQPLQLLGLGYSVGTLPEGLTAEALVVQSFEELDQIPAVSVAGKIVVYNQQYTSYGKSVKYRSLGATKASQKGAVAALVRSITPFSIGSPHTGMQNYGNGSKPIPVACITIEDAELLNRIYKRGKRIVLHIKMSAVLTRSISRNTLIDIDGSTKPEKIVIVSGHIDSWDVGQGAMDDGGGAFISWAVPIVLTKLNLKPKRTIRAILWTAEEFGLIGAQDYLKTHKNELENLNFVLESDSGTFRPTGLEISGNREVECVFEEIMKLFTFMNTSSLRLSSSPGSDITILTNLGIPGGSLMNENDKYFWYHHSNGDSMTVMDTKSLDLAAAFWTAVSFVIADISFDMPNTLSKDNL